MIDALGELFAVGGGLALLGALVYGIRYGSGRVQGPPHLTHDELTWVLVQCSQLATVLKAWTVVFAMPLGPLACLVGGISGAWGWLWGLVCFGLALVMRALDREGSRQVVLRVDLHAVRATSPRGRLRWMLPWSEVQSCRLGFAEATPQVLFETLAEVRTVAAPEAATRDLEDVLAWLCAARARIEAPRRAFEASERDRSAVEALAAASRTRDPSA